MSRWWGQLRRNRPLWLGLSCALLAVLPLGCDSPELVPYSYVPPPEDSTWWEPPVDLIPTFHNDPDWSRQGLIAYSDDGAVRDSMGRDYLLDTTLVGLWVLDPASGEKHRILASFPHPIDVDWSPDGRTLAFMNYQQLFAVNCDGTDLVQLTHEGWNCHPDWSPDGDSIAYDCLLGTGGFQLWVMASDGTGKRLVSPDPARSPAWNPDGSRLICTRVSRNDNGDLRHDLFSLRPDGTKVVQLTDSELEERDPQYSPDGTMIAFTGLSNEQIWVAEAGGSAPRRLTTLGGSHPTWSPSGAEIAFVRLNSYVDAPGNNVLWAVNVVTGEERQLTHRGP